MTALSCAKPGDSRVVHFERRTEWPLAVLALVFLGAYAWPILEPDLGAAWKHVCGVANYVIWIVFVLEFVCRIALAEHRIRYVYRHAIDVALVALPVLRPLRIVRLAYLLRTLNRRASHSLRGQVVIYVAGSAVLVLICASLAMLDAERDNPHANIHTFGDALWWAVATMTTVGYGDRYPTTGEGRAVGVGLMLAGIALLGVVTASIASWLIDQVRDANSQNQAATRGDLAALHDEITALRRQLCADQSA